MREASLLASVEKLLKQRGILYRKRHGTAFSVRGDPDLYFLYRGHHCEVELKAPGKSPTPLQTAKMRAWTEAGAIVQVVRSTREMREFLLDLDGIL